MLNYVKSELYRASRSPEIRETAAVFVGLVLLMNIVLCLLKGLEGFRYGITSFSYSNVVAMPMIFCYVASDVAVMLYESDRRNRTEQNCISYGMSRLELLAGKCIVSLAVSFVILVMILPVYICSAELLLDSAGPTTAADLLLELPAMSLIAIASLVLANVLLELFDKSIVSILVWLAVLVFLPKILLLAGMALATASSTLLLDIALWLPANFLTAQSQVNMSECVAIWDTAQGMAKCLIAGGAEIVVFGALGVVLLRKREL